MAIKMPHTVKPVSAEEKASAFISGAGVRGSRLAADHGAGKTTVNMRWDTALLQRVDTAAKSQGISRTAWLHVAAAKALNDVR